MRCPNCNVIVHDVPKRSSQQNRFLWFYLGLISDDTGHTAVELNEIYKRMFLPPRFIKYKGKEIKMAATTTTLTKSEFSDYLDRICMESGIKIPNPEQSNFISNNEPQNVVSPWRRK